jgi:phosphatidylglycerophosphate synthase
LPRTLQSQSVESIVTHTTDSHWRLPGNPLRASVLVTQVTALVAVVVVAAAAPAALPLGGAYPVKAAVLFTAIMLLAFGHIDAHHPFPRFGAANQVTTVRLALTVLVAGLIGESGAPGVATAAALTAVVITVLDGVDGWLSRRAQATSAFGARFDMETDALLIQVLAILAWQYGKAGSWVLLSGLLRYVFVAAGWLADWMRRPLFPSQRRKVICVVQVVGLILTLVPAVPPPESQVIAAVSLAALCYSFLVDTVWLWRHAP